VRTSAPAYAPARWRVLSLPLVVRGRWLNAASLGEQCLRTARWFVFYLLAWLEDDMDRMGNGRWLTFAGGRNGGRDGMVVW